MAGAGSRNCSECSSISSKYNCKNCKPITSTCSLECSKKHNLKNHPQSQTQKSVLVPSSTSTTSTFKPTSTFNSSSNPSTSTYVPINSYDSNQFHQDFNYLNQVGRYVSDLGRDLLSKRMIPQEMLNSNSSNNNQNQNQNSNQISGAAQHKRETLRKQLHFRGLSVLLLPEGMEMRKKNGTAWLHKESKMIYTIELRFPPATSISTSNSTDLNSSTSNLSSTKTSSQSQLDNKIILLNKQNGDSIFHRLVLEELEKRTLESKSKKIQEIQKDRKSGEGKEKDSVELGPSSQVDTTDSAAEVTPADSIIVELDSNESIQTKKNSSSADQSNGKGGKFSNRAKKRLKKESAAAAAASSTTDLEIDSKDSKNLEHQSQSREGNPIQNPSPKASQKKNQNRKSKKDSSLTSRISDPDFNPNFKISKKVWKEVGIQLVKEENSENNDVDVDMTMDLDVQEDDEEEVYQELPKSSILLLLPIFESRLRNETSLQYLDWFQRQKSRIGDPGEERNPEEISKDRINHSSSRKDARKESSNDDGKGNQNGKGKGRESNSNNIPLGPRSSTSSTIPNAHAAAGLQSSSWNSTPRFNSSSPISHYNGPPPPFNPHSSIPHYNGPPPASFQSLPSRPALMNGRGGEFKTVGGIGSNSNSNFLGQTQSHASQPRFPGTSTHQKQPDHSGIGSASPQKNNPLVPSSLLSKLSHMIPGAASKIKTTATTMTTNNSQLSNEESNGIGMDLEKLSKSASASTLFESLSNPPPPPSSSETKVVGSQVHSTISNSTTSRSSSNQNSDHGNGKGKQSFPRLPSSSAASSNPLSSTNAKPTSSAIKTRPRTLLSLRAKDSLEEVLKNLPDGFAVVEYPTIELWSLQRIEEMKRNGEVEIMKFEIQGKGDAREENAENGNGNENGRGNGNGKEKNEKKRSNDELNFEKNVEVGKKESNSSGNNGKKMKIESLNSSGLKTNQSSSFSHSTSTSTPTPTSSSPTKKSIANLVAYGSDSEEEDDEDQETSENQIAKSELLTNLDSEMRESDEESEEEEENWSSGVAALAKRFGIAEASDVVEVGKNEASPGKEEMKRQNQGEEGNPNHVRTESGGSGLLGQVEEELDWGEED